MGRTAPLIVALFWSAQGGWLGFGRKVYEGDKDCNRGTLNPAKRYKR